jgi:hypothetical protein
MQIARHWLECRCQSGTRILRSNNILNECGLVATRQSWVLCPAVIGWWQFLHPPPGCVPTRDTNKKKALTWISGAQTCSHSPPPYGTRNSAVKQDTTLVPYTRLILALVPSNRNLLLRALLYRVGQTQLGSFWSSITNQSNNTRENGKVPFVVDRWQLAFAIIW